LKLGLPYSDPVSVAATAITSYQQLFRRWESIFSDGIPPAGNAFNCKFTGVVVGTDINSCSGYKHRRA
jgi:hypothetical protein